MRRGASKVVSKDACSVRTRARARARAPPVNKATSRFPSPPVPLQVCKNVRPTDGDVLV